LDEAGGGVTVVESVFVVDWTAAGGGASPPPQPMRNVDAAAQTTANRISGRHVNSATARPKEPRLRLDRILSQQDMLKHFTFSREPLWLVGIAVSQSGTRLSRARFSVKLCSHPHLSTDQLLSERVDSILHHVLPMSHVATETPSDDQNALKSRNITSGSPVAERSGRPCPEHLLNRNNP